AFISVLDSGIGIPTEKQKDVLGRFKQSGHSSHIENNGSGIGLSLVKTLVDLHKGNINIKSGDGKGTEFIIDLPIRVTDHSTENFTESELSSEIAEAAKLEFSGLPTMMA
ncbi:MAG: ATP-binding protein, partial [Clostridia bacterium]|nr:ATP-binding protein [Clostridia bacterium]